MARKILFISPHTDDIEFGCGGTIRRFVDDKIEVYCIILSDCVNAIPEGFKKNSLNKECMSSLTLLGVKKDRIFIFQVENKEFQKNNVYETFPEQTVDIEVGNLFNYLINDKKLDTTFFNEKEKFSRQNGVQRRLGNDAACSGCGR